MAQITRILRERLTPNWSKSLKRTAAFDSSASKFRPSAALAFDPNIREIRVIRGFRIIYPSRALLNPFFGVQGKFSEKATTDDTKYTDTAGNIGPNPPENLRGLAFFRK